MKTKRLGIMSFTKRGGLLGRRLEECLSLEGFKCEAFSIPRYAAEVGLKPLDGELRTWVEQGFADLDGIIFIGAFGIVVRSIAPFVRDKFSDPAILGITEDGSYVVPLLSGHAGGANELARIIAENLKSTAVISTASDLNQCFAVDEFARKNGLLLKERKLAQELTVTLLNGSKVGFYSELPIEGVLPDGICDENAFICSKEETQPFGFAVTIYKERQPFLHTLHLVPKIVFLGVGCRRGVSQSAIAEFILGELDCLGIFGQAVAGVASIDLKKEEPGLVGFCESNGFPFGTYSAQELNAVEGEFSSSKFVKSVTGVDNVCERAARLASGNGTVLLNKTQRDGVTLAIAIKERRVRFE